MLSSFWYSGLPRIAGQPLCLSAMASHELDTKDWWQAVAMQWKEYGERLQKINVVWQAEVQRLEPLQKANQTWQAEVQQLKDEERSLLEDLRNAEEISTWWQAAAAWWEAEAAWNKAESAWWEAEAAWNAAESDWRGAEAAWNEAEANWWDMEGTMLVVDLALVRQQAAYIEEVISESLRRLPRARAMCRVLSS